MIILKTGKDIQNYLNAKAENNGKIGFIPTMGALHDGHISLVKKAKLDGYLSVCSIFLNPTQFNDKSDFEKYPVTTEADIELLIAAGCDVLFLPSVAEVYPQGTNNAETFDFGTLEKVLEGASRPGHFKGVGQVVARLLNLVRPNRLYLGQKDYQQCLIISKLVTIMGLNNTMEVAICPTTREPDGLAMSSRNRRLTHPQRAKAAILYQCLVSIASKQVAAPFHIIKKECEDLMTQKGLDPEYVAIADSRDLTPLQDFVPGTPMIALIAARVGSVRLIDNMILG